MSKEQWKLQKDQRESLLVLQCRMKYINATGHSITLSKTFKEGVLSTVISQSTGSVMKINKHIVSN